MSRVAIKGNESGTGTFTVEAPNSNTDRTLTLPDEAGTVLTTNTPLSSFPSGSLMQTVRGNDVETSNVTYSSVGSGWTEVSSSMRVSITAVTDNPYIEVYWITNVEADGTADDRLGGRIYVSIDGGSYTKFGNTHFIGNMSPDGQEDGGTFLWTGTITCSAGDTVIFTPYASLESGLDLQIQFGQDVMSSDIENRIIVKEYKS